MNDHFYAIVWIDHQEAKIFHLKATEIDRLVIRPHDPACRIRHETRSFGSDRPDGSGLLRSDRRGDRRREGNFDHRSGIAPNRSWSLMSCIAI